MPRTNRRASAFVAGVILAIAPYASAVLPAAQATRGRADAAPRGIEIGDLDRKVDPCTDFYEFANGSWRADHPIPASMTRWSRRISSQSSNKQKVQSILEDLATRKDWPSGSVEQRLSDHYASCMDERAINSQGVAPLSPVLAEIEGARSQSDLLRTIGRLHDMNIPVPFGAMGAMDYHAPKHFILNVVAGGLGLPDREDYVGTGARSAEVRKKYAAHVANLLVLGGTEPSKAREAADEILGLETRLAGASLPSTAAADPASTDHKMTFVQLKALTPHFDWDRYFEDARLPRVDLNVAEPKFMQQLDKEWESTSLATWKTYLQWRVLDSAAPWLSEAFVRASFEFKDKFLGGTTELKSRAERCTESTETLFGEELGRKYVERYFPPAAKKKVEEMTRNLQASLQDELATVDWMTPATKAKALAKLATAKVMAGYPDEWRESSPPGIRRGMFWANIVAGRRRKVSADREQIGKPTNRNAWLLPASSPGAYIDLQLNTLVLPAGFLQSPYFDLEATDAVNYGALGIGLAHDLTHSIDALGAETDIDGKPENWWPDTDRTAFDARAQCVVDQYEDYFIEPGVHHDGRRIRGEAIGDLTGVRLAYRAMQKSMAGRPIPTIDGLTPEQQFFISWGQTTGAAMGLEAQRAMIASDSHPVPKFRVIGPLSATPEFARAFSCKAGAAMVKPPEKRCKVW